MASILIVEDNEELAEVVGLALESEGHDIERTASGVTGAVLAAREAFDVALIDIDVEDLSGLGTARSVAELDRTAIIVMSGRAHAWEPEALAAGAAACLRKPFAPHALLDLVTAVLAGDGPRATRADGDVRRLDDDDLERVTNLSSRELDALPYGVIRVDRHGVVTAYNAFESRAAGIPPTCVVGRPLRELAPCLMVKAFVDRVVHAGRTGVLDETLAFVFPHHGGLCRVNVRAYLEPERSELWLFVSKRRGVAPAARTHGRRSDRQPSSTRASSPRTSPRTRRPARASRSSSSEGSPGKRGTRHRSPRRARRRPRCR